MEIRPVKDRLDTFAHRQCRNQLAGIGMAGLRDALEAFGTEQRHMDRGRRHQQALVGTNVRGRLGATDMLFTRL